MRPSRRAWPARPLVIAQIGGPARVPMPVVARSPAGIPADGATALGHSLRQRAVVQRLVAQLVSVPVPHHRTSAGAHKTRAAGPRRWRRRRRGGRRRRRPGKLRSGRLPVRGEARLGLQVAGVRACRVWAGRHPLPGSAARIRSAVRLAGVFVRAARLRGRMARQPRAGRAGASLRALLVIAFQAQLARPRLVETPRYVGHARGYRQADRGPHERQKQHQPAYCYAQSSASERRAGRLAAAAGRGAGACQPWANRGTIRRDLTTGDHS